MQIILKEETFGGKILEEILCNIEKEKMTVAELIGLKVSQEVEKHNQEVLRNYQAYQHPVETKLNPSQSTQALSKIMADIEQETYRACEAFQRNGMVILVDKRQVQELEEEIIFIPNMEVSFIRLTQLVGG